MPDDTANLPVVKVAAQAKNQLFVWLTSPWRAKTHGLSIRYKTAGGAIYPAVITGRTNNTTVNLRYGGRSGTTVTGATQINGRTSAGPGWYHAGR